MVENTCDILLHFSRWLWSTRCSNFGQHLILEPVIEGATFSGIQTSAAALAFVVQ